MDVYAMGGFHIGFWMLGSLLFIIPAYRILSRTGFSGWWQLLFIFPFFGFIGFWVFAFFPWPIDKSAEPTAT
jgi:uncharacterized membrane protein YhaH (DUF805 family)